MDLPQGFSPTMHAANCSADGSIRVDSSVGANSSIGMDGSIGAAGSIGAHGSIGTASSAAARGSQREGRPPQEAARLLWAAVGLSRGGSRTPGSDLRPSDGLGVY